MTFAKPGGEQLESPRILVRIPPGSVPLIEMPPSTEGGAPPPPSARVAPRPVAPAEDGPQPGRGDGQGAGPEEGLAALDRRMVGAAAGAAVPPRRAGARGAALLLLAGARDLRGIVPVVAGEGETVTLAGDGFDPAPDRNTVRFGDAKATVNAVTDDGLKVTIPPQPSGPGRGQGHGRDPGGPLGPVQLSDARRPCASPRSSPTWPWPGTRWPPSAPRAAEAVAVTVGGMEAQVVEAKASGIRFRVPALANLQPGASLKVHSPHRRRRVPAGDAALRDACPCCSRRPPPAPRPARS